MAALLVYATPLTGPAAHHSGGRHYDAPGITLHPRSWPARADVRHLDAGGLSAREIADQLGHARPSITMDRYMGRKIASDRGATVLESLA